MFFFLFTLQIMEKSNYLRQRIEKGLQFHIPNSIFAQ